MPHQRHCSATRNTLSLQISTKSVAQRVEIGDVSLSVFIWYRSFLQIASKPLDPWDLTEHTFIIQCFLWLQGCEHFSYVVVQSYICGFVILGCRSSCTYKWYWRIQFNVAPLQRA